MSLLDKLDFGPAPGEGRLRKRQQQVDPLERARQQLELQLLAGRVAEQNRPAVPAPPDPLDIAKFRADQQRWAAENQMDARRWAAEQDLANRRWQADYGLRAAQLRQANQPRPLSDAERAWYAARAEAQKALAEQRRWEMNRPQTPELPELPELPDSDTPWQEMAYRHPEWGPKLSQVNRELAFLKHKVELRDAQMATIAKSDPDGFQNNNTYRRLHRHQDIDRQKLYDARDRLDDLLKQAINVTRSEFLARRQAAQDAIDAARNGPRAQRQAPPQPPAQPPRQAARPPQGRATLPPTPRSRENIARAQQIIAKAGRPEWARKALAPPGSDPVGRPEWARVALAQEGFDPSFINLPGIQANIRAQGHSQFGDRGNKGGARAMYVNPKDAPPHQVRPGPLLPELKPTWTAPGRLEYRQRDPDDPLSAFAQRVVGAPTEEKAVGMVEKFLTANPTLPRESEQYLLRVLEQQFGKVG